MNIGTLHVHSGEFLPYLVLAYMLFFLIIFAYVVNLSRRQTHVQDDLTLLHRALDEETGKRAQAAGAQLAERHP